MQVNYGGLGLGTSDKTQHHIKHSIDGHLRVLATAESTAHTASISLRRMITRQAVPAFAGCTPILLFAPT